MQALDRRQRELFFKRLKQSEGRSVIEAVDWTPELAGAALRYAQAYRELIDALIAAQVESAELLAALSIDSLLITVTNYNRRSSCIPPCSTPAATCSTVAAAPLRCYKCG